ncbi:unnamed protein product [Cyprideis torosa]|uniref:Uncharacterized protein n=1 Tax=Cyprideis torosa TaxID=163714 RepID=A0A7R8ZSI7_9CRUS|nr:unnamed protein product [Cyprideis torosa]CAG0896136.1 unnamed protein product [Cyprideis torosa]
MCGANINAQTEETQETALTLAACGGFLDVCDYLLKAGANLELGASTPLMEAAQEGHLDLVKYFIDQKANIHAQTSTKDTALSYACENGHSSVVELLLNAGANIEHESEGGRTPLMKAARAGHLCTVKFLLDRGANINKTTDKNEHTALSLACGGGHVNVVELLLSYGADPYHRLKDNSTMLIEASKGGYAQVVQLLIDYPNSIMKRDSVGPEGGEEGVLNEGGASGGTDEHLQAPTMAATLGVASQSSQQGFDFSDAAARAGLIPPSGCIMLDYPGGYPPRPHSAPSSSTPPEDAKGGSDQDDFASTPLQEGQCLWEPI